MSTFGQQLKPRFGALGLIVLLVLGTLAIRLWSMQVLSGDEYAALAENNRIREYTLDAQRGRILDRNGIPLVTNRPSMAVAVSPSAKDDSELLLALSTLLDMPAQEIQDRVGSVREEALKPRVVAIDVPMDVISFLAENEARFPGVAVQTIAVREYPQGVLGAHLLGYTGEISEEQLQDAELEGYLLGDIVGKTGAEHEFETVLQGDRGYQRLEVDATGSPRRIIEQVDPIPGRDIILTIDAEVQAVTENALRAALEEAHADDFDAAKAGAAVAIDIQTGEILAMASLPGYDPELFLGGISQTEWAKLTDKDSEYPLTNRAISAQYPPASTFKVVTGLAGLQYGVTSEWATYYCPGKWTEMGEQWPKWCWKHAGHRNISFHSGVEESCDTVFYEIGYEFYKQGDEKLQGFARQFGLGEPLGIDLPGEVGGRVPDAAWKADYNENYPEYIKWLPGDTVNIAIGQGDLLVTPLQVASVYAGIANGGNVMQPHILSAVLGSDGEAVLTAESKVVHDVEVSDENLSVMRRALVAVTDTGTGSGAFRGFDVAVAGKTGTAEVSGKDDYAWFAAYAPANAPRYAVSVVIEQGGHGGSVAGPAAREILAALLGLPVEHVQATDISR
ncbi:MAG: penicillin-binding protein 2 [Actinomycetota bacterium]|jgi:penicillin-binding protein 2|nr:penicillin-binding protein 2 [Actinomycetota bacterium]